MKTKPAFKVKESQTNEVLSITQLLTAVSHEKKPVTQSALHKQPLSTKWGHNLNLYPLMSSLLKKTLSPPLSLQLLLAANLCALLFALTMQFGFGFKPCILCLWQRVPYGAAAILSLIALIWRPYRRRTAFLLTLCALAYCAGTALAFFHTGVERHWWLGTSGCAVQPLLGASPEEMRNALLQTIAPRCDEIPWEVFGLSMTNLNILASLCLAFFTCAVIKRMKK